MKKLVKGITLGILIYARINDLLFLSWLFNERIAILANIAYNIISQ